MAKILLLVTALVELATGVALFAFPSVPARLLLGASLDTPVGLTVARVAGAALQSLGIVCWVAREHGESRAGRGVIAAMIVYNIAVVAILAQARLGQGVGGVALWPAVALHLAMGVWCIACLRPMNPAGISTRNP